METIDEIIGRLGVRIDSSVNISQAALKAINENQGIFQTAKIDKKAFNALVGIIIKASPNVDPKSIIEELEKHK